jgi:hypothetical protein
MKAVVMEVKDGYAALLQDDGSVVKLKNRNFMIGDVVSMKEKPMRRKGRFTAMVAAAAMFVMLMGAGVLAYVTPTYFVSVDVNPSVLMEVNLFERVIGIQANESATEVLEGVNLKNQDIQNAISLTVAAIAQAGYFDEEGGEMLIAAAAKNRGKAEQLAERLGERARVETEEHGVRPEVATRVLGRDMVDAARALVPEITPGKYNIIVNLLGKDDEDIAEYAEMSIKELMAEFTAGKGEQGRARAAEARANEQTVEEGELDENPGKPEQPGKSGDTPAANKANVDAMNNAEGKKPDLPEVPPAGRP